ncbi:Phage protein U [Bosea sp. CRIB-10]|uniref:phage tail protein n=1 Tax=Bosea sp. CRIB-10 TaxID=378404 RepID=UPI0008E50FC5|nr:phage tail protein [Bosea sp. CRIB-10]SFB92546.1 Phage protein U [Bosea sp. CRIB-10]SFC22052.1 Phage protein U [Bosea sp. CRIB-10]
MVIPILAIGPHIFAALPLSIQTIKETTKANWPSVNRFGVGPARQFVGRGEDSFEVEGLYFHAEFGGHAQYLMLKATQSAGEPVELIGWSAAGAAAEVFGTVVILTVSATHKKITRAGIGAITEFSIELAPFGGDGSFGGLF